MGLALINTELLVVYLRDVEQVVFEVTGNVVAPIADPVEVLQGGGYVLVAPRRRARALVAVNAEIRRVDGAAVAPKLLEEPCNVDAVRSGGYRRLAMRAGLGRGLELACAFLLSRGKRRVEAEGKTSTHNNNLRRL